MKLTARRKRNLAVALGFLMPNLIGFLIFTAGPVAFSLIMSLSNWNLQQTMPFQWTFFGNFINLFHDKQFWLYFVNTIYFMLGMPVAIGGSLFLAILLSQKLRGITIYRTFFYLPSITSGIAIMILWKALYNPEFGPVNAFLNWMIDTSHINAIWHAAFHTNLAPPQWLMETKNLFGLDVENVGITAKQWGIGARDAIIIMGVWIAIGGNNMLLYLAALTNLPQEHVEAAQIDGAGKWAIFRNVTWPYLAPTTFFIVVMSFIGNLQGGFEQARVMTNGGPAGTTTTMSFYIFTKAFEEFQIGYASAVSWVLFIIIFLVTIINWRVSNKEVNY